MRMTAKPTKAMMRELLWLAASACNTWTLYDEARKGARDSFRRVRTESMLDEDMERVARHCEKVRRAIREAKEEE